jgi:hypothetical protein
MKLAFAATAVSLCLLASCKSGSGNSSSAAGSNTTFATLPANYSFALTAHKGLEVWDATTAGGPILTNPSASLITTSDGLTLTTPDGHTWAFDTQAASNDIVGAQHYQLTNAAGQNTELELTGGAASPLTYATYGFWAETSASTGLITDMGLFATGIRTASGQVPATGTATYSGALTGAELIQDPGTTPFVNATFTGAIAFNANFASNSISGEATSLTVSAATATEHLPVTAGTINDIAFTSGAISGTSFSGTATALPANALTTIDLAGAAGQFGGYFYGPNAVEAAGTFALTLGTTATKETNLVGSFGATTSTLTLASLTPGSALALPPGVALQVYASPGIVGAAGLLSNPTAGLVTATNGYVLTTPDGQNWTFNTSSGASDMVGPEEFRTQPTCNPTCTTVDLTLTSDAASALTYSTYGVWNESTNVNLVTFGAFATGIPTPSVEMPTAGTATYNGTTAGAAFNLSTNPATIQFTGTATLTANFSLNTISGSLTGLNATAIGSSTVIGQVSEIALTSGLISSTTFSGSASTGTTAGALVSTSGMVGNFGGQFYGPNAAEVAGTAALSGANGAALIASFGAHK